MSNMTSFLRNTRALWGEPGARTPNVAFPCGKDLTVAFHLGNVMYVPFLSESSLLLEICLLESLLPIFSPLRLTYEGDRSVVCVVLPAAAALRIDYSILASMRSNSAFYTSKGVLRCAQEVLWSCDPGTSPLQAGAYHDQGCAATCRMATWWVASLDGTRLGQMANYSPLSSYLGMSLPVWTRF